MDIQPGMHVSHATVEQVMQVISVNSDGKTVLCEWKESDGRGERGHFAIAALSAARPAPPPRTPAQASPFSRKAPNQNEKRGRRRRP